MVTSKIPKARAFTVDITRLHNGSALVEIRRDDGQVRTYQFAEKKLRVFAAIDGPVKDAVRFLLGDE
jgi:hypothetical protein